MTFDLLDEPWIPILYTDGRFARVGIRQALADAANIRLIAAANPMDNIALLRFLLAVLYWCKGIPPEAGRVTSSEPFPADWFSKLDDKKDCFKLLGDGSRFYQDGNCRGIEPEHTTNYLIHEVPSGTNKWHFRHSTDKADGLCPACCAMGLIRLPAFATSGGKGMMPDSGKSPGINAKPPSYALQVGPNLAATLRLSWLKTDLSMGTPTWETPELQLPKSGDVPLMTGLTWLPRRVWLGNPDEHKSACIACGRHERVIRRCVFDGKGSTKTEGRNWRDPHVLYSTSRKGEVISLHASDALGASDSAASSWSRLVAVVLGQQGTNDGNKLLVVGFASVQNDKYLEATDKVIPGPHLSPRSPVEIVKFEHWQKEGKRLEKRLERIMRSRVEGESLVAAIRPQVEHNVSAKVGELLAEGGDAWNRAAFEYSPLMKMIAKSLSPGYTTAAVQRRDQIAGVLPDMQSKPTPAKKPSRTKEGGT